MHTGQQSITYIPLPVSPARNSDHGRAGRSGHRRDYISAARAIAALRAAGLVAEPKLIDPRGAPLPEETAVALRDEIEDAIRDLAVGRAVHARRTIARLEASHTSDPDQVSDLLRSLYEANSRGEPSSDVLDAFLDTFERWLTPGGIARVDRLFETVDLDRAPEPTGILLLATTRLTREHFAQRQAFIDRLGRWLLGRSGRTQQDVDNLLRGLRE